MARFYKLLILLTSSIFFLSSCQEGGEAGDLFGQWRLKGSDTQYISFSGSVALLRSIDEGVVYGNFQHIDDSLFIQCVSISSSPADTAFIENSFGFKPFNDIRLKINTLNDDDLVLSKDGKTWSFYKY